MRSTSLHLFFHELRQAARENRWLLTITPLVTTFTLLVYHGVIPVRFDDRLGFLGNLLNFPWPILAWIVPYLILKTPDLQDPHALWRSLPATKPQVFGSRLLLATIATVVIPALMVAGAELAASSGHAWPQFLLMFAYQWAYLWIGAFAAFARRGHWGVVLTVLIPIALVAVAAVVLREGHSQLTSRGSFNASLLRMLPHWLIVGIGGPLVVLWRIRRAGKQANPFITLAAAAACVPVGIAIENRLILHPTLRGERLPTLRSEIAPTRPESGSISTLSWWESNSSANHIASVYAGTKLTLPPECAGARFEIKNLYATGSWENQRGQRRLDDFASNDAPYFILCPGNRTFSEEGYYGSDPGDPISSRLRETLGLTSNPELWIISEKKPNGDIRWKRIEPGLPRRTLNAAFLLPKPTLPEHEHELLQKKPVRIRAEVPLTFVAATNVICRASMKDLRKRIGMHEVALTIASPRHSVATVYGDERHLSLTLTKRIESGPLGNAFHWNAAPQYTGLVVNRRLGQVFLVNESSGGGAMKFTRSVESRCFFKFPREEFGVLSDSWWNEAEFVLLESEPGPEKILPLDIEIKVPTPTSAK